MAALLFKMIKLTGGLEAAAEWPTIHAWCMQGKCCWANELTLRGTDLWMTCDFKGIINNDLPLHTDNFVTDFVTWRARSWTLKKVEQVSMSMKFW